MTASKRDLAAELECWRDEPVRAWIPRVGGVLAGRLERYSRGEGRHGPAWIAQIRCERTGELRAAWLFHRVLLDEFRRLRPKPGERLGIKRLADGGREGAPYKRYAVVVDRGLEAEGIPDFDELLEADAGQEREADDRRQLSFIEELPAPNPFD